MALLSGHRRRGRAAASVALLVGVACAPARDRAPAHAAPSHVETGVASWYGHEFAGRPTASGEIFRPSRLTAAHRTLPLGSEVRVTNLDNGRTAVVRINDRGPFVPGRILDCSEGAAHALGFRGRGLARVAVEWPGDAEAGRPPESRFWVQVGSYRDADNARRARARAAAHEPSAHLQAAGGRVRVRTGPYDGRSDAEAARRRLRQAGFEASLVAVPGAR